VDVRLGVDDGELVPDGGEVLLAIHIYMLEEEGGLGWGYVPDDTRLLDPEVTVLDDEAKNRG